jgi:hypothetical protein
VNPLDAGVAVGPYLIEAVLGDRELLLSAMATGSHYAASPKS